MNNLINFLKKQLEWNFVYDPNQMRIDKLGNQTYIQDFDSLEGITYFFWNKKNGDYQTKFIPASSISKEDYFELRKLQID
jgi:hypothetical protein